jgi:tetratricopeptide (TPR) repeat protein
MRHYAQGAAFAKKKDASGVRAEAEAIHKIAAETDWSTLDAWAIPARPVLDVARNVLLARAAQAENDNDAAIGFWRKAADSEDTIPYMEPPFWYYPVRQSLGAALLKSGDPQSAQKEFKAALERSRGSAWALYGLEQAAKASGDTEGESKAAADLAKSWRGDPGLLSLEKL